MIANLRKVPLQSTGSGQNDKLVECDDTIAVSVSLLEQRLNFCVRDNAIAVGVCLAEHDCERPETTQHLTQLWHVDAAIVVEVKLVELCFDRGQLFCRVFGH